MIKGNFVKYPNLPVNDVNTVIASTADTTSAEAIESLGITILKSERNSLIQGATASHADMIALHLGKNKIAIDSGQTSLICSLKALGFDIEFYEKLGGSYPQDCCLNNLVIGNDFICGKRSHMSVSEYFNSRGFCIHPISQGYVRCSTAVVAKDAVISADKSVLAVCKDIGIDCLPIPPGEIRLEGYDYGFIGGSCLKLNANTLAFFGKVSALSYFDSMRLFCKKHNVEIVELGSGPVSDIGGALPIIENA